VYYSAILLRPFRNEVMDAVCVVATNENGFFSKVGPLEIFVSRHAMPEDMKFNQTQCMINICFSLNI
jgi:DNA-directed RNA polymerase II subunit RPB7